MTFELMKIFRRDWTVEYKFGTKSFQIEIKLVLPIEKSMQEIKAPQRSQSNNKQIVEAIEYVTEYILKWMVFDFNYLKLANTLTSFAYSNPLSSNSHLPTKHSLVLWINKQHAIDISFVSSTSWLLHCHMVDFRFVDINNQSSFCQLYTLSLLVGALT